MGAIRIAAAVVRRIDGRTLLVRKRGTPFFMQPGGKIDAGETPEAALCREVQEELGITVRFQDLIHLGRFCAPAANEPGHTVIAELFDILLDAPVRASAEIEELAWIDPSAPGILPLAPLTRDYALQLALRSQQRAY